jgi:hypothetical protein
MLPRSTAPGAHTDERNLAHGPDTAHSGTTHSLPFNTRTQGLMKTAEHCAAALFGQCQCLQPNSEWCRSRTKAQSANVVGGGNNILWAVRGEGQAEVVEEGGGVLQHVVDVAEDAYELLAREQRAKTAQLRLQRLEIAHAHALEAPLVRILRGEELGRDLALCCLSYLHLGAMLLSGGLGTCLKRLGVVDGSID